MDKLPPIEKILEAYSAIADNRVMVEAEKALVLSSNHAKEYTVTWKEDTYTSNDSASYWQGYAGYPIIAVLMLQGRLPLDKEIAGLFAKVNWTALNQKHKRNYAEAASEIIDSFADIKIRKQVDIEVNHVYVKLKDLDINVKRGTHPLKSNTKLNSNKLE